MKKSAVAAVGALVLVAGGALGIRSWGRSVPAPAPPPVAPATVVVASVPALPPDSSAGSIALRWIGSLAEQQENPPADAAQEELARSLERQFSDEIRKRLAQDPSRWTDVLEVISEENPSLGRRITETLRDAVGDAAEGELVRLVKGGRHRETRMASLTLVGGRNSNESLGALLTSAREDPDPGVRYQALSELLKRQGRRASENERTAIDQAVRWHAQADPDPALRQFALCALGQGADLLPPPNPPKKAPGAPGRFSASRSTSAPPEK